MSILQKILISVAIGMVLAFVGVFLLFDYYLDKNQVTIIEDRIAVKKTELKNNVTRISNKTLSHSANYSAIRVIKKEMFDYYQNKDFVKTQELIASKHKARSADYNRNIGTDVEMAFYTFEGRNLLRTWTQENGDSVITDNKMLQNVIKTKKPLSGIDIDEWGIYFRGFTPVFYNDSVFVGIVETRYPLTNLIENTVISENDKITFFIKDEEYKKATKLIDENPHSIGPYKSYLSSVNFDFDTLKLVYTDDNFVNNNFKDIGDKLYIQLQILNYSDNYIGNIVYQEDISAFIKYYDNIIYTMIYLGLVLLVLLAIILILIGRRIIKFPIAKIIKNINILSQGKTSRGFVVQNKDEIGDITDALNVLNNRFKELVDFSRQIGNGNYVTEFHKLSEEDDLGKALIDMRNKLRKAEEEEKRRKKEDENRQWANNGYVMISDLLRKEYDNIEEFSTTIVNNIVKYLAVNQGSMYLLEDDDGVKTLNLRASYAYDRKKHLNKIISYGNGLVGTCAIEKETIFMTDVPSDYVNITSGLGEANPTSILLVPLVLNDDVFGVIEFASFNEFKKFEIEFIEKVSQNIATTINSVQVNIKTSELLEQSQQQAEELAAQEEELRQNMEELQTTYEAADEKEKILKQKIEDLNK